MVLNKRNSEEKYDLFDRGMALLAASKAVTMGIIAAKEDLAKNPSDERAQSALNLFEITIPVLVEWGAELMETMDKEYGPLDERFKEVSGMLHEVFRVPLVN
jgi:hypothetical protein